MKEFSVKKLTSNGFGMREEILSFQKYMLNTPHYEPIFYLALLDYFFTLRKKGATYKGLIKKIKLIKKINMKVGIFCEAEIMFLQGNYCASNIILLEYERKYGCNTEVRYLLYKNYIMMGHKNNAQNILYELLELSDRKKTWMYLANSIDNIEDFLTFEKKIEEKIQLKNKFSDINLINYYSEAAIRAKEYSKAIDMWIKYIEYIKENKIVKKRKSKKFNSVHAENALKDLNEILSMNCVSFFLVSGTLLGCVRDNKILQHDKDLDIGIFESEIDFLSLKSIFQKSGIFEILPTRITTQIKLKHLNGVYIDVFFHKIENDMYWHYSSKIKWFNTPFSLKKINFLNQEFLIPDNTNLYLSENYGIDWDIPKIDFDSNFDTPNAVIINLEEMQVFYIKNLAYKLLYNDKYIFSIYKVYNSLNNEIKLRLKELT